MTYPFIETDKYNTYEARSRGSTRASLAAWCMQGRASFTLDQVALELSRISRLVVGSSPFLVNFKLINILTVANLVTHDVHWSTINCALLSQL